MTVALLSPKLLRSSFMPLRSRFMADGSGVKEIVAWLNRQRGGMTSSSENSPVLVMGSEIRGSWDNLARIGTDGVDVLVGEIVR